MQVEIVVLPMMPSQRKLISSIQHRIFFYAKPWIAQVPKSLAYTKKKQSITNNLH